MKIIHIVTSLGTGGIETMLVDIVNEQVNYYPVSIIIINNRINKTLINNISKKVRIYYINRPTGSKNPYYFLKLNYTLYKLKPDIIHCHGVEIIRYLSKVVLANKVKIVYTAHAMGINSVSQKKYNKVFAISNAVKNDIKNSVNIETTTIYNGIHPELIFLKRENNQDANFKLVNVSRLDIRTKGQDVLIRAVDYIINNLGKKNIYLTLIGEGESQELLESLVTKNKLNDYVTFLGNKDRTYIYQKLAEYDLFVHPSRDEGFGLTVVEAMAAKIPVLVSDIDGPIEIIEHGKFGCFFKNEDHIDLANKILEIMENYNTQETIQKVEDAYQRAYNVFDIKHTVNNYLTEYKVLCAE